MTQAVLDGAGLSYRILDTSPDGAFDVDVTAYVRETPSLTWTAIGGCETAQVQLDLPLSEFPTLGEQTRLVVSDHQGRLMWDGYCTDPGGVDDDTREGFDLVATGSMVLASDRVEPLVYADPDPARWGRTAASVASGRTDATDATEGPGWLLGHPQGYPIGPGTGVGIEYRALEHTAQPIGAVTLTLTGGSTDAGYQVQITTSHDGEVVDTITRGLVAASQTVYLRAGVDFSAGVDVVAVSMVRIGEATNVTSDQAWVKVTGITVRGARMDRFGATVDALAPLTSRAVVEDLIGRGMLGPVDPAAALVEDSVIVHLDLAWPEGIRGAAILAALRETDTEMVWMYGVGGRGGYEFSWASWPAGEVRYDLSDLDSLGRPGSEDHPCHRISVFYTDPDAGDGAQALRRVIVEVADAGGARVRDADPLNLGESTAADAQAAGEAELARLGSSQPATAAVGRRVLDRATGLLVEPWELRPGALARIEATGEVLRVTEVGCDVGPDGATAKLTLGDPAKSLEDKLVSFLRGEVDPSAPLIRVPSPPVVPPTTGWPGTIDEIYAAANEAAAAAQEAGERADFAFDTANGRIRWSLNEPGNTPNTLGDVWFRKDAASQNIIGQWEGLGGTSWASKQLRNEVIANLDAGKLVAGSAFINALNVLTNFTLGSSTIDGVIQTFNYANAETGVFINKYGLVAKGASIAGSDITGGRVIGAELTTASGSGRRVQISQGANPFQSNQSYGLVEFYNGQLGWDPGRIWGLYDSSQNRGELQLASPYQSSQGIGGSARLILGTNTAGFRYMTLQADSFYLGSGGTSVDFRLAYTNLFQIYSTGAENLQINTGATGTGFGATEIYSRAGGNTQPRQLGLKGSSLYFDAANVRTLTLSQPFAGGASPFLLDGNAQVGLLFRSGSGGAAGTLEVQDQFGGAGRRPIEASAFNVVSDQSWKDAIRPVDTAVALDEIRGVEVVEYGVKDFDPENVRTRGVVAQQVEQCVPYSVEGAEGSRAINLYVMAATAIGGLQELAKLHDTQQQTIDDLTRRLAALENGE